MRVLGKIVGFGFVCDHLRTFIRPVFRESGFGSTIRNYNRLRIAASASIYVIFLLVLLIICPLYFVPENIEAVTKNATPATLTYSLTSSTASVVLDISNISGTFASSASSGTDASFSLITDNASGYTVNLKVGSGGTGTLVDSNNSDVNSNSIGSITGVVSTTEFSSASGNDYNNKWGIMPSKYNGINNTTNYYPATTAGFQMDETSSANSTANNYTVGLGVRADFTASPGTYNNSAIIVEYVANPITYSINYFTANSEDVSGMPVANPQTGTISQGTTSTSVNLAVAPTRTGYSFLGWCMGTSSSSNITTTNGVDSCPSGSIFSAGQSFGIDATGTATDTYYLYAIWSVNSYTCTKQYRLQNADGTFPSTYTADGSEQVQYGSSCTYSKSLTDYTDSVASANNGTATTSATMGINGLTLSLSLYRNSFDLTVVAGANTSNVTGSGTYRWGETVTLGATKPANTTCITYANPTWTTTAGTAPIAGTSTTFTMPKANAIVTANSNATNVQFAVSLSMTDATGITIGDNTYTGSSTSLSCGTYTIEGTYPDDFVFYAWGTSGSVSVSDTTAESPSLTVSGAGSLSLTGRLYMQNVTEASCKKNIPDEEPIIGDIVTAYDIRDGNDYTIRWIAGNCWMTNDLRLAAGTVLTSEHSNVSTNYAIPTTDTSSQAYSATADLTSGNSLNEGRTHSGVNNYNEPVVWYNYCAITAGTVCAGGVITASYDICPAGWALPTPANFSSLGLDSYGSVVMPSGTGVNSRQYFYAFNSNRAPGLGGYYYNGSVSTPNSSRWWTATPSARSGYQTYSIALTFSSGRISYVSTSNGMQRSIGAFARCVLTNTDATYTCTKRYRLQNADGTFPSTYTVESTTEVEYGGSCSYTKSVADYKGSSSGTNNSAGTVSVNGIRNNSTLSISLYRNTFTLTNTKGDNISSMSSSGTYRWGQTVTVTANTPSSDTCGSYGIPTWTQSGTVGTLSATSGTSVDFTMGKGASTLTASATSSVVAQTITFATNNATSITLNGNTKTNGQTLSINCGTYNLSGSIPTGRTFSSWSATAGSIGSSSTLSTTYTVSGPATITLNATIDTHTCNKQYRLQNADGSFPSAYTSDGSSSVAYGSTCSYSKTLADYKGSASATNGSVASTSTTMGGSDITLSLSLYRNTYALTVNKNSSYISSATGAGTYRWGQSVPISATLASDLFIFTGWSQTAGTNGSFDSSSSLSTNFVMPKSAATLYADGEDNPPGLCTSSLTCMQTYTASLCSANATSQDVTLTDARDGKTYAVRYINGRCWMVQNLALAKGTTLTTQLSDRTSGSYTLSNYDFDSGANLWTQSVSHAGTTGKSGTGYWYNYCAASAGYVCSSGSTSNGIMSICPKKWKLPDSDEFSSITNYSSLFYPVSGGFCSENGCPYSNSTTSGYWWSYSHSGSSSGTSKMMHRGLVYSSTSSTFSISNHQRDQGYFVRCILRQE